MAKYYTSSVQETEELGEKIGKSIDYPAVIAFYGGMGMGKTAITRGIARGLGCKDIVNSPTFAIVHEYSGKCPVYHFDMFRVEGWDDLYSTGFFDYLDTNCVILIEWSENVENALPENTLKITINRGEGDFDRIIETNF